MAELTRPVYVPPAPPEGVEPVDLMATSTAGPVKEPAPNERVLCINRGRKVLTDTFDARHLEIPSGPFYIEYAAAKHLQARLIVPGTKNITSGGYVSYIGIRGIDPEALCEPFTDEELERYGEAHEAIDRSEDHGFGRDVKTVPTNAVRAASPTLGTGRGQAGIDASAQATPEAEAAAAEVLAPPTESATRDDAAEAAGARPRKGRG